MVIAAVLALYVCTVVLGGEQFLKLQRELRPEWRDKLYRSTPRR